MGMPLLHLIIGLAAPWVQNLHLVVPPKRDPYASFPLNLKYFSDSPPVKLGRV